jgi:8-amino-7-oxononanoate synthase
MKLPPRSLRSLPPEGRPREQGEAKARRARLRARVAADATTQRIGRDSAEAAGQSLGAARRNWMKLPPRSLRSLPPEGAGQSLGAARRD